MEVDKFLLSKWIIVGTILISLLEGGDYQCQK